MYIFFDCGLFYSQKYREYKIIVMTNTNLLLKMVVSKSIHKTNN